MILMNISLDFPHKPKPMLMRFTANSLPLSRARVPGAALAGMASRGWLLKMPGEKSKTCPTLKLEKSAVSTSAYHKRSESEKREAN
jgi:hypothetical protein